MKTKPKYKTIQRHVYGPRRLVCIANTPTNARKIARALNAMEKPKAKPFKFDWSKIEGRYHYLAMDSDGEWYLFETKPHANQSDVWACGGNFREIKLKTLPGDWRDSLQKRP